MTPAGGGGGGGGADLLGWLAVAAPVVLSGRARAFMRDLGVALRGVEPPVIRLWYDLWDVELDELRAADLITFTSAHGPALDVEVTLTDLGRVWLEHQS